MTSWMILVNNVKKWQPWITSFTCHWRIPCARFTSLKSKNLIALIIPARINWFIFTCRFFYMLHRPIIPIVYEVHDHYDKIAPPHSFINAAKFENMKQLADYLILLDNNDTLYNEYFWWKPHFEVKYCTSMSTMASVICVPLFTTRLYHRKSTEIWPTGGKDKPIASIHLTFPENSDWFCTIAVNKIIQIERI